jgi:23S rRNA (adenine2503-C2)-methyltransferase
MGCLFCATGKMGFHRNLRAHEIIQQVFAARFILGENVQNVVFMGMGEPFDNFDEVMNAVDILSDEAGMGIGLRRITLSTSGDTRGILHLAAKGQKIPNLAVSLHSADEEIRKNLVPARRKESLSTLHNAMKTYCENTGRQILISCVLLKNINDDLRAAEKLVDYLQGLSVKVNIIPYNQSGVGEYMSPDPSVVEAFLQYLRGRHIPALLRHERGGKNQAACGQLGSRYQNDFYA